MKDFLKQHQQILFPFFACFAFVILWGTFGWAPFDRAELPLARLIHSTAGRSDTVDWLIIFLNRRWGEALFVILILASFLIVARQATAPGEDRRRILGFAVVIFATWVVANFVGEGILEPALRRASPSFQLGEDFTDLAVLHEVKVKVRASHCFPSNHGTVFMLVVVMSVYRYGRRAWVLFPVAVVLSLPRCFTGAHWVGDSVIGSLLMTWLIGAIVMTTPLSKLADLAERAAVAVLPRWLAGPGPMVGSPPSQGDTAARLT
jgi:membrane-associated phospholipid phosphatase